MLKRYNRKIKNRKFKEAFMNKKLYFGSNFKMYKNIKDTEEYLQAITTATEDIDRNEVQFFFISLIFFLRASVFIDDAHPVVVRTFKQHIWIHSISATIVDFLQEVTLTQSFKCPAYRLNAHPC